MVEWEQGQKGIHWLLIGSLGIGCLQDYLFYNKELGISYLVFVAFLYIFFFWQARQRINLRWSRQQAFAWLLTLPVVMLAATFFLFSNPYFHRLNFLLVPSLFVIQTVLLAQRSHHPWYSLGFVGELVEILLIHTLKVTKVPFSYIRDRIKARVDRTRYGIAIKVLTGVVISLPILLVVLWLLSQADSVFGHFLSEIPATLLEWISVETMFRLCGIGFVAIMVFAYLWSLLGPREESMVPVVPSQGEKLVWDGIILVTILTIINVVYAAFTFIQISYLFSGAHTALPDGMTYAEYARKGFGELVMVTIINFIILLSFMHLTSRAQQTIYRIVQILLSLLTVCTGFMLYSAYFRLSLYEEAYGYTYSRLLAHAFMIFLFVLFVIALCKIWRDGFSLIQYYVIAGLIAYVLLNYINVDVLIAENNIRRYEQTGRIDIDYLADLSYDAIPAVMRLTGDKSLADTLLYRLEEKREDLAREQAWQSFNLSKYRATQYLHMPGFGGAKTAP